MSSDDIVKNLQQDSTYTCEEEDDNYGRSEQDREMGKELLIS